LDELLKNVQNIQENFQSLTNQAVGVAIEIYESQWYQETYGFDIVQAVMTELESVSLTTLAEVDAALIPVVLSSENTDDIVILSGLTDLPLVQVVYFNETYDYGQISQYASAVKAELPCLLYDSMHDTDYSPTSYSNFVTQMHDQNLAVHAW